jgi:hypothetical protein
MQETLLKCSYAVEWNNGRGETGVKPMGKLSLLRGSTNNTIIDVVNSSIGQFNLRYTRYLRI